MIKKVDMTWGLFAMLITSAITAVIITLLFGCTTKVHKFKNRAEVETIEKSKYDLDIKLLNTELLHLQSELRQRQYAGVAFDTMECPKHAPVFITGCSSDSINALVAFLNARIELYNENMEKMSNEIEILNDGSILAKGRIRTATYSNEVAQKLVSMWKKRYDSLVAINAEVKANMKTDIKQVEVQRTVTLIPWYYWLILALVCGATYYVTKKYYGKY